MNVVSVHPADVGLPKSLRLIRRPRPGGLPRGEAWCWGSENFLGELGDGSTDPTLVPVQAGGVSNAFEVSAGNLVTCVRELGSVRCWGDNYFGSLGNGANYSSLTPVAVLAGL